MPTSGVTFKPRHTAILLIATATALFGCQRYAVTLNQQPIYTPPQLYAGYTVADQALMDCIKQTILDKNIVRREQLITLTCRHAGLTSLQGLEHFTALQALDVSNNQLETVAALAALPQLTSLKVNDNPHLQCDSLTKLQQRGLTVTAPAHCTP